ncbi:MAG: hypothetical protein N2314_03315 [Brevinematales bacterium]|nr:hypothetical protein [Brevinematales bacterium]
MPNGSHEIIDDFELDMDIETITLDDIDLREFEEPLPQEFATGPGSMEVGSIGNIENIQISTANFGGGAGEGKTEPFGERGGGGVSSGEVPLSGSFSLQPEEITLSAPSITIQTENLTVTAPHASSQATEEAVAKAAAPSLGESSPSPFSEDVLASGVGEAPSLESLNVDELEFGGPISLEGGQEIPQELEVPRIEKEDTLHLLSEEEPPLQEPVGEEMVSKEEAGSGSELVGEEVVPEIRPINDKDEIISLSGDELDRFLYGDTLGGVPVVSEEEGEEVILPPQEEASAEVLISPQHVASPVERVYVESSKNQVPLEENFELIVENEASAAQEMLYVSEPTEVLRDSGETPEREEVVPLPDLSELDKVVGEPVEISEEEKAKPSSLSAEEPTLLEVEELSLEPIPFEEEPVILEGKGETGPSFFQEETSPSSLEMVETEPLVVEVGESPLVSEIPLSGGEEQTQEKDFQFDLSAIPDLQPTVEDENEPIALSLEELNNIEVTEEPPLTISSVSAEEEEGNVEVASTGPEEAFMELRSPLDVPVETEVPLSPESFESIIAEEEKIEEIKQQDLNQLIEIAEPDVEVLASEGETPGGETEVLPPIEEAETVEVSLADLGVGTPEEVSEPIVREAYIEPSGGEEMDRRQVIETNLDAMSGTTREELRKVIQYLDNLLADLPEEKIKEFAQSEYYDLYMKIMEKLGL